MPDIIAGIFVFIFGSIVGSFLNVCIHRLPLGESVVWPHSHCPKCQKKIPTYDNLPFLSYLLLKGRCRFCKERISLRYPLVELLTAVIFLALFQRYGLSYDFVVFMVLACALIIAAFVDIKHRIIPEEVSLGCMALGFILTAVKGFGLRPITYDLKPMVNSFLGILIGGGIIYLFGFLFDLVYFKLLKKPPIQGETKSMNLGDVELLAMIGAFLGWQKVILVFFLAPFPGMVFGMKNLRIKIINIRVKKGQDVSYGPSLRMKIFNTVAIVYLKDHILPYGPFLSLAAIFSIFWADKIIRIFVPFY